MSACHYCKNENPDEVNYCLNCFKQIRCKNIGCGALLMLNAPICVVCGTKIETDQGITNRFSRRVKSSRTTYEENIDIVASDEAVRALGNSIFKNIMNTDGALQYGVGVYERDKDKNRVAASPIAAIEAQKAERQNPEQQESASAVKGIVPSIAQIAYCELINNSLVFKENDFKGESWKEQQINFILLFIHAYRSFIGVPVPTEDVIKAEAAKIGVYDTNNFKRYLTEVSREFCSNLGEDGIILNSPGERKVREIIAKMGNDGLEGHPYWDKAPSSSKQRHRMSQADKAEVDNWVLEDIDEYLGEIDVRQCSSGRQYTMIALWLICIKLNKAKVLFSGQIVYYMKCKFKTISVSDEAISKSLSAKANADVFKESDGAYYLSPDGEKVVNSWALKGIE